MKLEDERNGISIALAYDSDGFPLINIDLGGGFQGDNQRPAVEVKLAGILIHDMFDENDQRWKNNPGPGSVVGWQIVEIESDNPPDGMKTSEIQAIAAANQVRLADLLAAGKNVAYNATPLANQPDFVKIPKECVEHLLACIQDIERLPFEPRGSSPTRSGG